VAELPVVTTRWQPSLGIVAVFAALSLIPVVALGVGLGSALNSAVRQHDLAAADRIAQILAEGGIEPQLTPQDLSAPLSAERIAQLDQGLRGIAFGAQVARLKIWDPQGTVVYSDNHNLIAHTFPIDENLEGALRGDNASEIALGNAPENRGDNLNGTYLSVYVPLYFNGESKPAGAFELYLPWAPVQAQIDQESKSLYWWLAAGLAALYASLLPLVLVSDRWRRNLITSLETAEAERNHAADAIRMSELKSSFLSGLSHELRTPLNSVLGFAQLLRETGSDQLTSVQTKYVANIEKGGRHLLALVNDVLDLSKIEAGRMDLELVPVALSWMVLETIDILHPIANAKAVELIADVDPSLVLRADRLRLTQVLVNLLTNAIKFTPAGGRVEISATSRGADVEILVTDTGSGIPPEEQVAIFEEFVQGDRRRTGRSDGTGLGLPLSRKLVELMAGHLELVESSPAGSRFLVRLPAAVPPDPQTMKLESLFRTAHGDQATVTRP
jgi:signal transduction histidine kinase